jgi:hypothetical protein
MVEWLKVKTLSTNPCATQKRKKLAANLNPAVLLSTLCFSLPWCSDGY